MARCRATGVELSPMPKNKHDSTHREDAKQVSDWGKWRPWVLVLLIIGGLVVAMLWLRGELSLWLVGLAALLLTVATAIPAAVLWLQGKGESALPKWLRQRKVVRETFEMLGEAPRELVRDPRLIIQLSLLNLVVFVADGATLLLCLVALGVQAPFDAAFVA